MKRTLRFASGGGRCFRDQRLPRVADRIARFVSTIRAVVFAPTLPLTVAFAVRVPREPGSALTITRRDLTAFLEGPPAPFVRQVELPRIISRRIATVFAAVYNLIHACAVLYRVCERG